MTSPYILCIDTTRDHCAVLLSVGGHLSAIIQSPTPIDHSKSISLLAAQILNDAKVTLKDLSALAVNLGPGSYTSLRTGLSFSLGLHLATSLPLIGYNTLEVLGFLGSSDCPGLQSIMSAVALPGEAFFGGMVDLDKFILIDRGQYYSSYLQMTKDLNTLSLTTEIIKYPEKITSTSVSGSLSKSLNLLDECACALVHTRHARRESSSNIWQPLYIRPPFITQAKHKMTSQQI